MPWNSERPASAGQIRIDIFIQICCVGQDSSLKLFRCWVQHCDLDVCVWRDPCWARTAYRTSPMRMWCLARVCYVCMHIYIYIYMLCVYAVCTKYNNINGTMINDAIFFTQNHAINIVIHIHTLLIFVWILCMYLLEFFFCARRRRFVHATPVTPHGWRYARQFSMHIIRIKSFAPLNFSRLKVVWGARDTHPLCIVWICLYYPRDQCRLSSSRIRFP